MRVLRVILDHQDCCFVGSIQRHFRCTFCRRHWRHRRSSVAQTSSSRSEQVQRPTFALLVIHQEMERLLAIVAIQRMSVIVLAQQRLERIGGQYEVRNVRSVLTLYRNISFCIVRRNPSRAVSFRDYRTLSVSAHQPNSTWILLREPLETPKSGFVICGGRLRTPVQMSLVSVRRQYRPSRYL